MSPITHADFSENAKPFAQALALESGARVRAEGRAQYLREVVQHIADVTPHKQGCERPDDVWCAACIAEAGLAADAERA